MDGKKSKFSKIKKGEFFKFPNGKKVNIYRGKPNRGFYTYGSFDNHNDEHHTKTDREIIIGFTF